MWKRLSSAIRSILPNVVWDVIKKAWRWFKASPYYAPVVMGAFMTVGTYITAYLERLRGMPPELQGVLIIALVWLVVISAVFLFARLKAKRGDAAPITTKAGPQQDATSAAKALETAQDAAADWQAKHGVLKAELNALNPKLNAVVKERDGLLKSAREKDKQLKALRDEIARYKSPQVDAVYKPEPPYRRVFPSPDGKQKRTEYYIGVICLAVIENLSVELEAYGEDGKIYPRVRLSEEDRAKPETAEPPYEKLFFLAEELPDGKVKIQADVPENFPRQFNVIISGSNTLPQVKRAVLGYMGKYGPSMFFHLQGSFN
jgi:hypothetical protein